MRLRSAGEVLRASNCLEQWGGLGEDRRWKAREKREPKARGGGRSGQGQTRERATWIGQVMSDDLWLRQRYSGEPSRNWPAKEVRALGSRTPV